MSALFALFLSVDGTAQSFIMADGANWETCTGTFYDSGGAGGDHGNSESMTATLCPTGGVGAGPFTSITFTSWNVGLALDALVIHDGATTAGTVLATGTALVSLNGQTFTATDPSGCLTFAWTSDPTLTGTGWSAAINTGTDAGGDGSITVCSTAPDFDLFNLLTGTPDPGGEWTFAGNLVSNIFQPGTSPEGDYTYTVPAVAPCVDASATVTVTVVQAADAGFDNAITVCSDDANFSMRDQLLGTPDPGGQWSDLNGPVNDQFNPGTEAGGTFVYTVDGDPPCVGATAELTITVFQAPDAGGPATTTVCSTAPPFDLFALLTGSPDPGGTWTGPNHASHGAQFIPGTDVAGQYTYHLAGQSPCVDDSAKVTVNVQTAVSPGTNTDSTLCSNGSPINMRLALGTSATNGTWSGPSPVPGNQYNPVTMLPGFYTYTLPATGACPASGATIEMIENEAPDAGGNGTKTTCSIGPNFDLFTRLTGTPDAGGTWTDPDAQPFPTGIYVPGTSEAGVYTYTVTGLPPCASDVSIVTVTQVTAPFAGMNGSVTFCSNHAPDTLFEYLGGTPTAGGTWYKPVPPGGTIGGIYQPANVNHPAGVYTYVVAAVSPCPSDSATVTVVEMQAPNAGTNGNLTLCSTSPVANLINSLGGSPNGTGSWLDPVNAASNGQFNPATGLEGTYKYIVTGTSPCITDTGFVNVVVNDAPDAGLSGDTTVCSTGGQFELILVLNGTPDPGGQWNPGDGDYDCGTGEQSIFTYTVDGIAPCIDAQAVATVIEHQLPDAGSNGSEMVCSTDGAFDLFDELNGDPDPGGTWTPGDPGGIYTPGTSVAGIYTYTVAGTAPCPNDAATVNVQEAPAPDAGQNGVITVCAGNNNVPLFPGLGGTPDAGGTWTALDNINPGFLSLGVFTTNGVPPGNYDFRYALPPAGPCGDDDAEVRVTIASVLDAGSNGSCTVCNANTAYNLFQCIGSNPQAGGVWKRLPAGTIVPNGLFNANGLADGVVIQFRYVLTGSMGCQSDSSLATLTIEAAPDAGPATSSIAVCSSSDPVDLFAQLLQPFGGQSGGQWKKQGSPGILSGFYDPDDLGPMGNPGLFYYIKQGTSPCGPDTARVNVTETAAPNAGCPTNVTLCALSPAFNMTNALNCNPAINGTWTDPDGDPHSSTFQPGTDEPGFWTYTVQGTSPCSPVFVTLGITVNDESDAGQDGTLSVCSTPQTFPLDNVLGGNPDPGGTWYDTSGTVIPSGDYETGVLPPGEHTFMYVISAASPCVNDTAYATIFESQQPDAGISTSPQLCSNGGAVDLITLLGGTPDLNGTWANGFSGTYVPALNDPGEFVYTVTGVPPCGSSSASVTVDEEDPPFAGFDTNIQRCSSQGPLVMFPMLAGPPSAPNGIWYENGVPMSGIFDPTGRPAGNYPFVYVLAGNGVCAADSATLTINYNIAPDAGGPQAGTAAFCSTTLSAPLFPYLTGTPQTGGTWRRPGGQPHTGTFITATDPVGTYTYRKAGLGNCPADSATVVVSVNQQPDPGSAGLMYVCTSQDCPSMFPYLGGTPDTGGDWTTSLGVDHSQFFCTNSDNSGIFTYTVEGEFPCVNASATVQVIENQETHAGGNGAEELCSDQPGTFPLTDVLVDDPDLDGAWFSPGGAPFPTGIYDPGTTPEGTYMYVVSGDAPCVNDTAYASIFETPAADPGISTAPQVCTSADPVALFELLGGDPDIGGTWKDPNGQPHGQFFDPDTDQPGAYTYVLAGFDPCDSDSAQVSITLVSAPNAGDDGATSACVNEDSVDLFAALGGSPQTTGTWSGPNQVNGIFDATAVAPGTYTFTYTVSGGGSCAADDAEVTVEVSNALDAGVDGTAQVCSGTTPHLFPLLSGPAQAGGIWYELETTNALTGDEFNAGAVGAGFYDFAYVLQGTANCPGDSVILTVEVIAGPDAGVSSPLPLCSSVDPFDMTDYLGASADPDGQWYDPDGNPHIDIYDPGTEPGGVYTYVVTGFAGCLSDSATLNIIRFIAPNAGIDADVAICSIGDLVDLFPVLGGSPDAGGNWTCCGGQNHSGIYNPLIHEPDEYVYTVQGLGTCEDASATVDVTEQPAPNAGDPTVIAPCSGAGPFSMLDQLSGNPSTGGTWTDPDGLLHSEFFDPAVDSAGIFTYTLSTGPACDPDVATLTVNLVYAPDAGEDSTLNACASDTLVDLFEALGPEADSNGTWTDVSGVGSAFQNGVLDATLVPLGTYIFEYDVPPAAPCLGDQATLTVIVDNGANPGVGDTSTICGGNIAYDMFNTLTPPFDNDGVWASGPIPGVLDGNFLNASLLPPGGPYNFTYTVTDPGCGSETTDVVIYVSTYPDPGGDSTLVLCNTDAQFDLFDVLNGTPDQGGQWTRNGFPVDPNFDPATDPGGVYSYNLNGEAPCVDTSAQVTITVNTPPQAGDDAQLQRCNADSVDLTVALSPNAQPGGSWTDVDNTGQLDSNILQLDELAVGPYDFIYTVTVAGCGSDAADIVLTVVDGVQVTDDTLICNEVDRTYIVAFNIEGGDPTSYSVVGVDEDTTSQLPFDFVSLPLFTSQAFSLTVDDANNCTPRVLEGLTPCVFDDPVFMPESFTPNGDDVNDLLLIPGIEGYPDNTLDIFNRWGSEVYSAAGYDNRSVVWDGSCENALLPGELPTGTYYYVLELGAGIEPIKGFIYLNR